MLKVNPFLLTVSLIEKLQITQILGRFQILVAFTQSGMFSKYKSLSKYFGIFTCGHRCIC